MSGWADELDSAYDLVAKEIAELRAKESAHELLRFEPIIFEVEGEELLPPEEETRLQDEFKERFWQRGGEPLKEIRGTPVVTTLLAHYLVELRRVNSGEPHSKEYGPPRPRGWSSGPTGSTSPLQTVPF